MSPLVIGAARAGLIYNNKSSNGLINVPSAVTDPYFSNVSLLLHMNGSNGSTTFTDNSNNSLTPTVFGDTKISTTQSKFGGSSAYFDGNGDYLKYDANSAFNFGSSPLTIECWLYLSAFSSSVNIFSTRASDLSASLQLRIETGRVLYFILNGGTAAGSGPTSVPLTSWAHIALTREGNVMKMWLNGNLEGTINLSAGYTYASGLSLTIGRENYSAVNYLNGYISEFRITKGIARYTSNFPVPTAPFPNS